MKKEMSSDFIEARARAAKSHIDRALKNIEKSGANDVIVLDFSLALHALTDAAMAYATRSHK